MKQKEMLRKAAWVAFGLVLAIEVTAIAGESAQEDRKRRMHRDNMCIRSAAQKALFPMWCRPSCRAS